MHNWVRSAGQAGSTSSPWQQERTHGGTGSGEGAESRTYIPYRGDEKAMLDPSPLFHLGGGLGYSTFTLSDLKVEVLPSVSASASAATEAPSDAPVAPGNRSVLLAHVRVANVGSRPGSTVVQLYCQ